MREKIKFILSFLIILLFLPYICVVLFHNNVQAENVFFSIGNSTVEENNMDSELFVAGVLASQMPVSYEKEALKAQAVIARTQIYRMLEEKGIEDLEAEDLPQYMSISEMEKVWGYSKMQDYYSKLKEAVTETQGITMKYKGKYIEPSFHAVSNGNSRSGNEVYHSEDYPYLTKVDNPYDILSEDYLKVIMISKEELAEKMNQEFGSNLLAESILNQINVKSKDGAGYVTNVQIGECTMAGEEFRKILDLNSSCFIIEESEGKIRITTKGLGHGIGLSQFNANEMAKNGDDYQKILNYYFKNIELVNE